MSRGASIRRLLFALLVCTVVFGGIELRLWTWRRTKHLRYQHDIVNGFYWGSETLTQAKRLAPNQVAANSWPGFLRGYLSLYDRVKGQAYEGEYQLDYPPLRLLAMSIWAKHLHRDFPGAEDGKPEYVEPLLQLNLICELTTAVGIFLLVRLWLLRARGATHSRFLQKFSAPERDWICALAAASAAWLEPSLILDAHAWPQWDVWLLPFYVWAALAASTHRWFWCGCLLAVGAMLKGQLLFVTPFFVFWPLWQREWRGALRVLAGFFATTALVTAPWLIRNQLAGLTVALICGIGYVLLRLASVRHRVVWLSAVFAIAVFLAGTFLGGSFAWLQIGFLYGSEHYPYLFISSCYNIPSLLADHGWSLKDVFWSHDFGSLHLALNLQWSLRIIYLGGLALCAWGVARHTQRHDARALMAMAAPWLIMFVLLGQMHERYLMWGAVVSALALGVNVRLSAFHFLISLASSAMIVHVLLADKKLDPTLHALDLLQKARPYASWIVLVCIALCLWNIFVPAHAPPEPAIDAEPVPA
jgi:glycosyl transferase family 87